MKSNHIIGVKWSALCLHITNGSSSLKWHNECKKFFIVIINFMHNLGQYNLVQLIVMYGFMQNCSFQICLHMHPKSFDAGLKACADTIRDARTGFGEFVIHMSLQLSVRTQSLWCINLRRTWLPFGHNCLFQLSKGARFTNDFLPAIQIRWKLRLAVRRES